MTAEVFYLYMSILATLAFIVNVWGAISAHTNAFLIQKPWFKDYLSKKEIDDCSE